MSALHYLHDSTTGYAFKHPVVLPCGHTFDVSTVVRISQCTLDRRPFEHVNLRTNYSIQDGLQQIRGNSNQPTHQMVFFFQNSQLRFIQKGSVAATLTKKEWCRAEETYAWMCKNLPQNYQAHLTTPFVIQGVLEWNSQESEYVYTLLSEDHDLELTNLFQLTIKENWARNFAGPYFTSLKSK